jgi:thioredoxin-like negative regulator of GroEL
MIRARIIQWAILGVCLSGLGLMAATTTATAPAEAEEPAWETDVDQAMKAGLARHRPVLLQFSASWCQYCRMMASTTLKDPSVRRDLEQFVRVAVDYDQQTNWVRRFAIRGIPAYVILNEAGEEVVQRSGFLEAARFSEWLVQGMALAAHSLVKKQMFQERCRQVQQALENSDVAIRQQGLSVLLGFCSDREESHRTYAADQLKQMADRDLAGLLEGLNHPELAARIETANCLRAKLGEAFKVDPWEKAAVRATAVQEWRIRLSASQKPL